jgi:predicted O-methyltransferase YrrM
VLTEPPLVRRALALAAELGVEHSCTAEVGRLLHVLAGARGRTRVGEIGTGCGVGAAWMLSALAPAVPFVTVELDPTRARAAAGLLSGDGSARVLEGDWREAMPREAPFDLLFHDAVGEARPDLDGEAVVGLLAPRGLVVLDDLTPGRPLEADPVRAFWLRHPALAATELLVAPQAAVIVGVRRE